MNIAYKFVPKKHWCEFVKSEATIFTGYGDDFKDGFIHMSTFKQLHDTFFNIKKYNEDDKKNFKLLAINLSTVENLLWERSQNGQYYPHLYGGIQVDRDLLWTIDMDNFEI